MSNELKSRLLAVPHVRAANVGIFQSRLLASACLSLALAYPRAAVAQAAVGDVVAADATVTGSVQTTATGTRVMSGSSIKAGGSTAAVRLLRGGELRVCPRSTVSLTTSQTGRDLAIAMGTGGIETHYRLRSSADTIMTPDFRILLAGPGAFDYAISADSRGNTCVRSLVGNGASIIVSEIMGDGTYQVQPGEQAYFRNGSVANPSAAAPPDCGCPPPAATMNANTQPQNAPAPIPPVTPPAASAPPPAPANEAPAQPAKVPAGSPEAVFAEHGHPVANASPNAVAPAPAQNAPVPKPPDNEIHVQVDAPFVFRGDEPTNIPPEPTIAKLRLLYLPKLIVETQDVTVLPPAKPEKPKKEQAANQQQEKPASRGFFGHVRAFFGALFK